MKLHERGFVAVGLLSSFSLTFFPSVFLSILSIILFFFLSFLFLDNWHTPAILISGALMNEARFRNLKAHLLVSDKTICIDQHTFHLI